MDGDYLKFMLVVIVIACGILGEAVKRGPGNVMGDDKKIAHFKRLNGKIFIGKEHKRPFIVATDTHVWNSDMGAWVRY